MPVVTCVEVLDAHVQWDPSGFSATMSSISEPNHAEQSCRMQITGAPEYKLVIGMNDLSAPWDRGIVAICGLVVLSSTDDHNVEVGATNYCGLSMPSLGDKQCFAGAVV
jgi:hypothetical protein